MENQEYLELLQSSDSFKEMPEQFKKQVMAAQGEIRESYARIYRAELAASREIAHEFAEANVNAVKAVKEETKVVVKEFNKIAEDITTHQDDVATDQMLKDLN